MKYAADLEKRLQVGNYLDLDTLIPEVSSPPFSIAQAAHSGHSPYSGAQGLNIA